MDYILGFLGAFFFICFVFGIIGMWKSTTDPMTDYELYGMDADEYEKRMIEDNEKMYGDER